MAIPENRVMGYVLAFHVLTLLLLAIYAISIGLVFSLFLIVVCEAIIFLHARDNTKLFFFLWQVPFFIVLLLALLMRPHELFNFGEIPSLAQPLFIAVLVLIEAVAAAICFLGERPIKAVLFGSTAVMIAAVVLIIALIGSEGIAGLTENDPIEMLGSTGWSAGHDPDTVYYLSIPTATVPYDFDIGTNNSVVHVQPGKEATLSIVIMNRGALEDRYSISVSAPSEIGLDLSQATVAVGGNNETEVSLTLCSSTLGSFKVRVQVENGEHEGMSKVSKDLTINLEVSNTGIELDRDNQRVIRQGSDGAMGSIPFSVTNTGTKAVNLTFVVTASSLFRPSISGTSDWVYGNSTGYSQLQAGEVGNYSLMPRFVTAEDGVYEIKIEVRINGTEIHEIYNLVFDFKQVRAAWSLNDWLLPIYKGTETEWKIVLSSPGHRQLYIMMTSAPEGYSATALINGTCVPLDTEEWEWVGLDNNGTAVLTMSVSASPGALSETSELVIGVKATGYSSSFGIAGFLAGTVTTVFFALLLAVPLALGSAIFLAEYAPSRLRKVIKPIMEILAGIPSVVYGLWGGLTLGPFLATNLYPFISFTLGSVVPFFAATNEPMSRSIFTASIVLGIMIFPIIMALSYDALAIVPKDLKDASLATGASRWQTIRKVAMVKAKSGIIASVVLGTGRAIGETMAVLMIMGVTSRLPDSIFTSVGTMTSAIASQFGETFAYDTSRHGLFAIAFLLFLMVFILNLAVLSVTRERSGGRRNSLLKRLRAVKKTIVARWARGAETRDIRSQFRPSARSVQADNFAKWGLYAVAAILLGVVAYIIGDVIIRGGSSFELSFLLEVESGIGADGGGFQNAVIGSLALVAVAIGVSAPVSVMAAIYVNEYANKNSPIIHLTTFATNTLASTPSIIYGAFGFMMFVMYLGFKPSLLVGGLTLALMATPLIFVSASEGLKAVPGYFREASYALGVSKWATIRNVIMPVSFPSISSGVIIAIGRTIGETAAVIFTAGYAAKLVGSLFMPTASLPNLIYKYYNYSFIAPSVSEKLYAASFVLIVIIIVLNLTARLIAAQSQKKMGIAEGAGDMGQKWARRSLVEKLVRGKKSG